MASKYLCFKADQAKEAVPFIGKLGWYYVHRNDLFDGVNGETPPTTPPRRLTEIDLHKRHIPFVSQGMNFPLFVTLNPNRFSWPILNHIAMALDKIVGRA